MWLARFLLLALGVSAGVADGNIAVLSVGSNRSFSRDLAPLKYAASDAVRFAAAMSTVGLINQYNVTKSINASIREFEKSLDQISSLYSSPSGADYSKFIFYYSGHADERGFHFKDGLYPKDRFHSFLRAVNARTKVVILDSCFAGSLAARGVKQVKNFEMPKLSFDEPSGTIFLSASSATDVSFESDTMGGGIFSSHILSGIYGSADGNEDGVVTATELYQYSFRESQLQKHYYPSGQAGKPEFLSELKGRGAISLSFPSRVMGDLRLASDLQGELIIRSQRGIQFFKIAKPYGEEKVVRLPEGDYQIRSGDLIAYSSVSKTKPSHLGLMNFSPAPRAGALTATKGLPITSGLDLHSDTRAYLGQTFGRITGLVIGVSYNYGKYNWTGEFGGFNRQSYGSGEVSGRYVAFFGGLPVFSLSPEAFPRTTFVPMAGVAHVKREVSSYEPYGEIYSFGVKSKHSDSNVEILARLNMEMELTKELGLSLRVTEAFFGESEYRHFVSGAQLALGYSFKSW